MHRLFETFLSELGRFASRDLTAIWEQVILIATIAVYAADTA